MGYGGDTRLRRQVTLLFLCDGIKNANEHLSVIGIVGLSLFQPLPASAQILCCPGASS